jgi:hypothetical protein
MEIAKRRHEMSTIESQTKVLPEILDVWEHPDLRDPLLATCTDRDIRNITTAFPFKEEQQRQELTKLAQRKPSFQQYRLLDLLRAENQMLHSQIEELSRSSSNHRHFHLTEEESHQSGIFYLEDKRRIQMAGRPSSNIGLVTTTVNNPFQRKQDTPILSFSHMLEDARKIVNDI